MSEESLVLVAQSQGVALVTINRPKALNALSPEVMGVLTQTLNTLEADREVRALIITGAGEKAFVAGADISRMVDLSANEAAAFGRAGQAVFTQLEYSRLPVIAAINGFALGGGCELALACDLRVVAEGARLGLPEVGLGVIPGYGGTQRLGRVVGRGKALEMILTADMIDAQEAYRIGLANAVVPLAELIPTAQKLASRILKNGPIAVALAKRAFYLGENQDITTALNIEAQNFGLVCATADKAEGLKAFVEKRKPTYRGL